MLVLTPEQKQRIREYAKGYPDWLITEKGKQNLAEHREHEQYLKKRLSSENIDKMSESEFREIYKTIWASAIWSNKDWYISNKLLAPNGLDKIKLHLKTLLYGQGDIENRYDEFVGNIKGFGTSSISEILHMVFPEKYCLWNDKPKTVLPFLGLNILPDNFFKYQLNNGNEYMQCVKALEVVKEELADFGVKDFIDLDIYFWHIFEDSILAENPTVVKRSVGDKMVAPIQQKIKIDSHEGAEYYLLELGKVLGYSPYTVDQSASFVGNKLGEVALLKQIPPFAAERDMKTVKEIDVIWFNEEENPKYCFEVEHTTDIVHGLDRLIQLQHLYVTFVIVASEEKRAKYESLLDRVQYRRIRNRFRFISYEELASLFESAVPFNQLKTKLLGE